MIGICCARGGGSGTDGDKLIGIDLAWPQASLPLMPDCGKILIRLKIFESMIKFALTRLMVSF